MPRVPVAVAMIALSTLAGCGSSTTRTVTVHEAATRPTVATKIIKQAAQTPSMRTCSTGVAVDANASCPFAESILAAYASATNEEHGVVYLGVESPTTRKTYAVECSHGGRELITCHASDAKIALTFGAVSAARASHPAPTTTSSTPANSRLITAYPHCPYGADTVTHEEKEEGFSSHCLKPNGAQETGEEEHRVEEREEKQDEREGREPAWVKEKVEEREDGG